MRKTTLTTQSRLIAKSLLKENNSYHPVTLDCKKPIERMACYDHCCEQLGEAFRAAQTYSPICFVLFLKSRFMHSISSLPQQDNYNL